MIGPGSDKNKQERVPFHKPQSCIFDAYTRCWKNVHRVFVSNVMASIRKEKIGSAKGAQWCPFDRGEWGVESYLGNTRLS